ncbi:hypothetical protein GCM10007385_31180 [Tateyamaria omphalii]|nr:hypothetical protein GCM10007385_31180 [Tateyamaria omphalii]
MIGGLAVGLVLPELAQFLRPWVGPLVALLLFVTGIRIGARKAFGSLGELAPALVRIGILQTGLPLCVAAVLHHAEMLQHPLAIAVTLMLAAPSLTGAPNFAIMMGRDPVPGMRLLVLSTALFPLTAIPVLLILDPTGSGPIGALSLSLELLLTILGAVGLGFAVRHLGAGLEAPATHNVLDGIAALLLAVVVVGLMSAVGPLFRTAPMELLLWLMVALLINFTLVAATLFAGAWAQIQFTLSTAIYAGNRNIALFLIALPDTVAAPLMIFVGCYQVPMYLTPILMSRLQIPRS